MADSIEEIQKAKKTYLAVFAALFVCTILTVAVASWYPLERWIGGHGFDTWDMIVGLGIATFKVCLVGAIFMHLNHEKKAIYWIFFGSIVFCAAMGALIALAKNDPIFDKFFY